LQPLQKESYKRALSVIYLVALENIVDNAIFSNQVKKLLLGINRESGKGIRLTLVCLLPWFELTRRGVHSNFRRYRRELGNIRTELEREGLRLAVVRTLFPSAFFNMGPLGLAWLSLISLPAVWYQILVRKARVVHCRYYYAGFIALLAAKLSFRRVKVIFDVRTLLPEQGLVNGTWSPGSLEFRFWKAVERWMFRRSDRVMAVSPAMSTRISEADPKVRVEAIPNFVDLELFHPDPGLRTEKRRELGLEEREVLAFSGTLGGRYPAERTAAAAHAFFQIFGDKSFLLLLTSSDQKRLAPLAESLGSLGLEPGTHWKALNVSPEEVPAYLNAADWGLLVLADFLTSETFLPLKFGEYLALGLPVLTHPANRELVRLVESYGVGGALEESLEPQVLLQRLEEKKSEMRRRCLETASAEFDLRRFASRYAEIYSELAR